MKKKTHGSFKVFDARVLLLALAMGSVAIGGIGIMFGTFPGGMIAAADVGFTNKSTASAPDAKKVKELRETTAKLRGTASLRSESMATSTNEQRELAKARKNAILALIEKNPEAVEPFLYASEERSALPPEVAEYVEQFATKKGTFESSIFESFPKDKRPSYTRADAVREGALRTMLHYTDAEPDLESGSMISVSGYVIDDQMLVPEPRKNLSATFSFSSLLGQAAIPTGSLHEQVKAGNPLKSAVILVNFSDDQSRPYTPEFWRSAVFTGSSSVRAFYREASFGRATFTGAKRPDGDIYGWVTIPMTKAGAGSVAGLYQLADQAQAAAQSMGYLPANYQQVIFVFPRTTYIHDAGGELGSTVAAGTPARVWMNGMYSPEVMIHEVGHNFNVMHANLHVCYNSSDTRRVTLSTNCFDLEYGDALDVMGYRILRHQNGFFKQKMNFFDQKNVMTITKSGLYTLYPIETPLALWKPQTYRISRNANEYIYLDYRQPFGFDRYARTDPATQGASIRFVPKEGTRASYLLDTTPHSKPDAPSYYAYTPDFADGALAAGRTFTDTLAKPGPIKIKTVSVATSSIVLEVTLP